MRAPAIAWTVSLENMPLVLRPWYALIVYLVSTLQIFIAALIALLSLPEILELSVLLRLLLPRLHT
jgi:hypothetical protein